MEKMGREKQKGKRKNRKGVADGLGGMVVI
jgi:hypothetical protein